MSFDLIFYFLIIIFISSWKEIKRQSGVLASKQPFDAHKYAYISNVVVAKYVRRRGIASNMLGLATHIATYVG